MATIPIPPALAVCRNRLDDSPDAQGRGSHLRTLSWPLRSPGGHSRRTPPLRGPTRRWLATIRSHRPLIVVVDHGGAGGADNGLGRYAADIQAKWDGKPSRTAFRTLNCTGRAVRRRPRSDGRRPGRCTARRRGSGGGFGGSWSWLGWGFLLSCADKSNDTGELFRRCSRGQRGGRLGCLGSDFLPHRDSPSARYERAARSAIQAGHGRVTFAAARRSAVGFNSETFRSLGVPPSTRQRGNASGGVWPKPPS